MTADAVMRETLIGLAGLIGLYVAALMIVLVVVTISCKRGKR